MVGVGLSPVPHLGCLQAFLFSEWPEEYSQIVFQFLKHDLPVIKLTPKIQLKAFKFHTVRKLYLDISSAVPSVFYTIS